MRLMKRSMNEYCICVLCCPGAWKQICERRPNWQQRMDNPETMATLGTREIGRRPHKLKTWAIRTTPWYSRRV